MPEQIKAVLEGLLFLVGDEGLSSAQLATVLEHEEAEIEAWLDELMKDY